jgi:hypothetical protein
MKLFKQIIGYGLLIAFLGSLAFKFNDSISDVPGSEFIVLMAILFVLMILFGINKILQH